jgi:hypothetical protein
MPAIFPVAMLGKDYRYPFTPVGVGSAPYLKSKRGYLGQDAGDPSTWDWDTLTAAGLKREDFVIPSTATKQQKESKIEDVVNRVFSLFGRGVDQAERVKALLVSENPNEAKTVSDKVDELTWFQRNQVAVVGGAVVLVVGVVLLAGMQRRRRRR